MNPTSTEHELLRELAQHLGPVLATAICCEDGIRRAVTGKFGGSFGQGETWGHFAYERAGIEVYRQATASTVVVPWAAVRAVRATAPKATLDALADAVAACESGPRYRVFTLPLHLRPEGRDPGMSDAELEAARQAVHEKWCQEVRDPHRAHQDAAYRALHAALDAVFAAAPRQGGLFEALTVGGLS